MATEFKPYDYQKKAINWIVAHTRCALFLDMGLGKTVSTLTAVKWLKQHDAANKTLVVAPKKVAETTWTSETAKWEHLKELRVVRVIGTQKQRVEALETKADIYVVGRDTLVWLNEYYKSRTPFDVLVLDELSSFKSHKAQRTKAAIKISKSAERVIGLTGTPAPNGLIDLWAQMYCIDLGERLESGITKYRQAYFSDFCPSGTFHIYKLRRGMDRIIMDKISDITLSMQAKDFLTLPDRIDHTEMIELPVNVQRAYEKFEKDSVLDFMDTIGDGSIIASNVLSLMGKLSQFSSGAVYDGDMQIHEQHGEKLEKLAEIVEAAQSPVLVFYQFKHDAIRIKAYMKAYKVRQYEGEQDLLDWNAGKIDVLLAHPASCAYGLNMQHGGHYIVWFSTGWNLEQYQQANARLHRQGQKCPVHVYHLVCKGTVDERALGALEDKKTVQQGLLDGLDYLKMKYKLNL